MPRGTRSFRRSRMPRNGPGTSLPWKRSCSRISRASVRGLLSSPRCAGCVGERLEPLVELVAARAVERRVDVHRLPVDGRHRAQVFERLRRVARLLGELAQLGRAHLGRVGDARRDEAHRQQQHDARCAGAPHSPPGPRGSSGGCQSSSRLLALVVLVGLVLPGGLAERGRRAPPGGGRSVVVGRGRRVVAGGGADGESSSTGGVGDVVADRARSARRPQRTAACPTRAASRHRGPRTASRRRRVRAPSDRRRRAARRSANRARPWAASPPAGASSRGPHR